MARQGSPDPREFRYHREVGGALAAGSAITVAGSPFVKKEPTAGAARVRFYTKISVAGTLDVYPVHPDGTTNYDTVLFSTALVANTELVSDIDPFMGVGVVSVELTAGATGTITYLDIMQV